MSIRKEGHIDPNADRKVIRDEVIKEVRRIGEEAKSLMLEYLSKHNIDDRDDLAKSIGYEVEVELNKIKLQFGANAKHAIFVHDGTKPHWIGKDTKAGKALRSWVVRKLNVKGKDIDSTTFFVRRKIAMKGTKAKPFAAVTMRLIRREAPKRIQEAIERGVRRAS